MQAASACAVSSPAAASGTCRPPPTTCASYTGNLSAAPNQPQGGTPTAIGPSSGPPEARQGRLSALLDRFKRQRPAIQQQPLEQAAAKSRRAIAGDIPSPTTILWFDQDDHPVVPTCTCPSRRAQWPSRMPAGHRRRRRVASWTAASTTAPSPPAGA